MLHTVNKSPFERNSVLSCLAHAAEGSAILFIEDAVYAATKGTTVAAQVAEAVGKCKVYVLGPDLAARGMGEDRVLDGVTVVDYGGFVDLTVEHGAVQAWL
ncbi:sulfurtransferase complex subunit TusB [Novispirillum sp. DQ9]|uniref:sulfurtransferase complex subunit TusB n=1 Tax=Novispirillum sp. DQ9 TaxID=3398612 RepID=UPI003C7D0FD7